MHLQIKELFDIYFFIWEKLYNFVFGLSCLNLNIESRRVLETILWDSSRRVEHGEIERHIYAKRALGGTIIQDILKAFTWRFVHDYLKLRNFHYPVTNLATVDVYGCDYITTNGVLYLY